MTTTLAAVLSKQARYRDRLRHPRRSVYRIEVQQDQVISALVASGLLAEHEIDRRDKVEVALSRHVEDWIPEVLR
jgi:hypothetical protein